VTTHSSLISTANLGEAKPARFEPRLAQVCVDPLFARLRRFPEDRARVVDATFVTTAGAALAQFATATNVSSYNFQIPIDASIESARGFERADQAFDYSSQRTPPATGRTIGAGTTPRLIAEAGTVSVDYHGFDGRRRCFGAEYLAGSKLAHGVEHQFRSRRIREHPRSGGPALPL